MIIVHIFIHGVTHEMFDIVVDLKEFSISESVQRLSGKKEFNRVAMRDVQDNKFTTIVAQKFVPGLRYDECALILIDKTRTSIDDDFHFS